MEQTSKRIEKVGGVAAVLLLLVGCLLVLRPFITPILLAGVFCFSTWPFYLWLLRKLKGHRNLASLLMVICIAIAVLAPFAIVGVSLSKNAANIAQSISSFMENGLPEPPATVERIPFLREYWAHLNDPAARSEFLDIVKVAQTWIVRRGIALGAGVLELTLSIFIAFFIYRDGERLARVISHAINRIVGDQTQHYLTLVGRTVRGVMYGVVGGALAQGCLAALGYWIVGLSAPLFLGFVTFFLAFLPVGPALIWCPVGIWLLAKGDVFSGVLMLVYGLIFITGVENILRPYLISRGAKLPFVHVFIGVVGGLLAFGFLGVFLGPVLLAMGNSLLREWVATKTGTATAVSDRATEETQAYVEPLPPGQ